MIGTGWHGHMFPGAVAPFGMVQLSPDTSGAPEPKWNEKWDIYSWDHCSGYHYSDNFVLGFSHTHLQGTGASDLGDVLLMPLVQGRNWGWGSGEPGEESEAQIEAIGVDSGWSSTTRSVGIALLSLMNGRRLAPATTQCISIFPVYT
jgi:putative alpha-1,2-mannosidase